MKTIKQIDFADIFAYADQYYSVSWNACNDLFFHTVLEYGSVSDFELGEWQGYCDFWKDETSFEIKASSFTKEDVKGMDDRDRATIILAAYCESEGIEDSTIQIDCR